MRRESGCVLNGNPAAPVLRHGRSDTARTGADSRSWAGEKSGFYSHFFFLNHTRQPTAMTAQRTNTAG